MNYVEVAVPFFVLAIALEFGYGYLVKRQTYRLSDTINSLSLGLLSRLVDILRFGVSAALLGGLAEALRVPQWSMDAAWQWVVAFVAYDFCYYWKHRFGHEWRIMWASHVAHHQSEAFNLSTALRQSGTDFIGFLFYLPLFLAGIPTAAVITVGSLNLIYQFWVHTEHIRDLGPMEAVFVTPSNHRVHHARNERYLDKNYGGVFIVWDRLFGTFQAECADERCIYGITKPLQSWNPLWANVHFWFETAQVAWRTRSWRDRLSIWFKRPAWYPSDVQPPVRPPTERAFDPPLDVFPRLYVFIQYWVLLLGSLWLLDAQRHLPRILVLIGFAWLCLSLYVHGAWLEARRSRRTLEWARIACAFSIALLALFTWPTTATAAAAFASYAALCTAVLALEHVVSGFTKSNPMTSQSGIR